MGGSWFELSDIKKNIKENGSKTKQEPMFRQKSGKVHIQVGLDFGTSTTKVVYKQIGRNKSQAIHFNHGLGNYPDYCLPSLAAYDKRGRLLLGIEAAKYLFDDPWDTGFQRLKVIVAGNCNKDFCDPITNEQYKEYCKACSFARRADPEELTAIYLAYAMHMARKYILKRQEYCDVDVDLAFNICMPIDHIGNNQTKAIFEYIFKKAENIESEWPISQDSYDFYSGSGNSRSEESKIFAVPESVAQIASYLQSLQRQEKLHAIIDFGAGTTDISIFNYTEVFGDSATWWFAAKNLPRGTINIERALSSHIANANNKSTCNQSEIYKCLQDIAKVNLKKMDPNDGKFKMLVAVRKELEDLRTSKKYKDIWDVAYNRYSRIERWDDVDVFICGGGANMPFVKETFSMSWKDPLKTRYTVRKIPYPDDYDGGEANAPFERMSVAYGLAIPKPQLDKYVLPDDVPPYKKTKESKKVREIDHEDIYSEK